MSLAATMAALVLLGVCANVASARTLLNFSPDGNLEDVEVENASEEDLESFQSVLEEIGEENSGCSCKDVTCECCHKIKIKKLKAKFCIALTYKPSTESLVAALKIGRRCIWKAEFPVRRLPSPCIRLKVFKVCLAFANVRVENKVLSGCVELTVSGLVRIKIKLGCFRIRFGESVADQEPAILPPPLVRAMKMEEEEREDVEMTKAVQRFVAEMQNNLQISL